MSIRKIATIATAAFLAIIVAAGIYMSMVTVDKGHVGVVAHWSAVQPKPLDPGLHFVTPFRTGVTEMSTKLGTYEVAGEKALSKDLQVVTTTISVQRSLVGPVAPVVLDNIGSVHDLDETVINPAIQESLKAVSARYTAEELVTKRDSVKTEVTQAIKDYIAATLAEKDIEGALHIANVAIEDFSFSAQFDKSIEAKVTAQQQALEAVNKKKERITNAEAMYEEAIRQADAEAYRITKESIAKAEAIDREAQALQDNPDLLRLRAAEKWNGELPVFNSGDQSGTGVVPFVNVTPEGGLEGSNRQ